VGQNAKTVRNFEGREVRLGDRAHLDRAFDDFDASPTFAEVLPQRLEGGYTIENVGALCSLCGEPCSTTRGQITRPYPWMLDAVGHGWCAPCRFLTPVHARFQHRRRDRQASLSWIDGQTWRQCPVEQLRVTWCGEVRMLFRRLSNRLRRSIRQ